MKIKLLLLALVTLGIGGGMFYLSSEGEDIVADYATRNSQVKMTSAEGAFEIQRMLKGNIETGQIEPEDYLRMSKAVREHQKANGNNKEVGFTWEELGPDNVAGRVRAILVLSEDEWISGSVSGGLFKTMNGGDTWSKMTTFPNVRIVGSIAQTLNGDIYVGTGSTFESGGSGTGGSGFLGTGLYRSPDLGVTWELVDGTEPNFMSTSSDWNSINALEADPFQEDKVWIAADAGVGYYESETNALTMNTSAADGLTTSTGQDLDFADDGSIMLAVQGSGRIYMSTDGGASFESLSGGSDGVLPSNMSRARVAISDADPNYCYVLYAANNGAMGGAWYSDDMGATWTEKWPGGVSTLDPMGSNTQGFYDLALCVDPADPAKAYVGGVTTWEYGPDVNPAQIAFLGGFGDNYVHADVHEIVRTEGGKVIIGTDGGIFVTEDNGDTFYAANRGYNITQFYGIGISSGNATAGGSQDNSTTFIPRDGSLTTLQEGITLIGGDGFYTELSQATGGIGALIGTSQFGRFERYDDNGNGGPFYDLNMENQALDGSLEAGGFYTTIALFEDTEDEDSQQLMIVGNNENFDITDTTIVGFTNNLNIPFDYVLEEGDTLHFWEEIERPAVVTTSPILEDPIYWWEDVQVLDSIVEVCDLDSVFIETVNMEIGETPILECDTFINSTMTDTIIACDTIGYDPVFGDVDVYEYFESCFDEYYYGADVISNVREQRRITDPYTSMFVIGFTGTDGIWLTREALNFGVAPHWYRIVDEAPGGFSGTKRFEFTQEGNDLFYCGWGSQLYRVTNLDSLWTAAILSDGSESFTGGDVDSLVQSLAYPNAGGTITGMASDPNNPNHMVISIGGYGNVAQGKVQETWNALDDSPDWENIWLSSSDELSRMPCYDVLIDATDESGATILVGTEFGIWATDNGGDDWAQENDPSDIEQTSGIDECPVFELRQQKILEPMQFREPENSGIIYAGTHGRGMFRTKLHQIVSVNEPMLDQEPQEMMLIYPNPVNNMATVEFDLDQNRDVTIDIYSVQGKLVKSIQRNNLVQGTQVLQLDLSDLGTGNYILHMNAGSNSAVSKFVKM